MAYASEHRCTDGTWKPGPARTCEACQKKRPFKVGQHIHVRTGRL